MFQQNKSISETNSRIEDQSKPKWIKNSNHNKLILEHNLKIKVSDLTWVFDPVHAEDLRYGVCRGACGLSNDMLDLGPDRLDPV